MELLKETISDHRSACWFPWWLCCCPSWSGIRSDADGHLALSRVESQSEFPSLSVILQRGAMCQAEAFSWSQNSLLMTPAPKERSSNPWAALADYPASILQRLQHYCFPHISVRLRITWSLTRLLTYRSECCIFQCCINEIIQLNSIFWMLLRICRNLSLVTSHQEGSGFQSGLQPFCVVFACSPWARVAFLQGLRLPPTGQRQESWVNWSVWINGRCECEWLFIFVCEPSKRLGGPLGGIYNNIYCIMHNLYHTHSHTHTQGSSIKQEIELYVKSFTLFHAKLINIILFAFTLIKWLGGRPGSRLLEKKKV